MGSALFERTLFAGARRPFEAIGASEERSDVTAKVVKIRGPGGEVMIIFNKSFAKEKRQIWIKAQQQQTSSAMTGVEKMIETQQTTEHQESHLMQEAISKLTKMNYTDQWIELDKKWRTRGEEFLQYTTKKHQAAQQRILPFLAIPDEDRFQVFSKVAEELGWKATTKNLYWAALHSAGEILGISRSHSTRIAQRVFSAAAKRTNKWDPKAEDGKMEFVTPVVVRYLLSNLQETNDLLPEEKIHLMAIILCYFLGDRLGDLLKLRVSEIRVQKFPLISSPVYKIGYVEGKKIDQVGRYPKFIPQQSIPGRIMEHLLQRANSAPYLFLRANNIVENKNQLAQLISAEEKRYHETLAKLRSQMDLRALRRGGLSCMMYVGVPQDVVLTFSAHTNTRTLAEYLDHGSFNGDLADKQCRAILAVEDKLKTEWEMF